MGSTSASSLRMRGPGSGSGRGCPLTAWNMQTLHPFALWHRIGDRSLLMSYSNPRVGRKHSRSVGSGAVAAEILQGLLRCNALAHRPLPGLLCVCHPNHSPLQSDKAVALTVTAWNGCGGRQMGDGKPGGGGGKDGAGAGLRVWPRWHCRCPLRCPCYYD